MNDLDKRIKCNASRSVVSTKLGMRRIASTRMRRRSILGRWREWLDVCCGWYDVDNVRLPNNWKGDIYLPCDG